MAIAGNSDEAMIAVETDSGAVVCVPIIWLLDDGSWTVAYHRNGEPIIRVEGGHQYVRAVRRHEIKRILG